MSIINALILGSSTTVSTPTTAKSTDESMSTDKVITDDSSNSSPSVIIVAASLGAVLFVALIILIAVVILRRKKRQGKGIESPSTVRTKPWLLFPTWKKLSWYDDLEPLPSRKPITVLLPLGENHWRCQNVIFQMLFSFDWILGLTKSNIAAVPKWRTFKCLEWKLISFTLYQKFITG